jgi:hypothetical protein
MHSCRSDNPTDRVMDGEAMVVTTNTVLLPHQCDVSDMMPVEFDEQPSVLMETELSSLDCR